MRFYSDVEDSVNACLLRLRGLNWQGQNAFLITAPWCSIIVKDLLKIRHILLECVSSFKGTE